jgi:iron complex transport system substrate-binding protein
MKRILLFILLAGVLSGCRGKAASSAVFNRAVYTPQYASGFDILGAEGWQSTVIRVRNPWQGAKEVEMAYFIARNGEKPPRDFRGGVIRAGAERIVCMSSTYIAMLDALGQVGRVVGVSGMEYISNPYVLARRDEIKDVGAEINYESLVGLKPDLVLLYGVSDALAATTDKMNELGIPYMYVGDYLEESPLGKAEWMVVLSELTDCRAAGERVFGAVPERYDALKRLVSGVTRRPAVMLNTPWNDSWMMPSVNNFVVRLIRDAGGDYIYPKNTSHSSVAIGLETAYGLIREADVWLNTGRVTSLAELLAVDEKFSDAKAVREKKVYNNNLRLTPGGGNDYWESGCVRPDVVLRDLIRILHPELLEEGDLYYYRHLE